MARKRTEMFFVYEAEEADLHIMVVWAYGVCDAVILKPSVNVRGGTFNLCDEVNHLLLAFTFQH